MPSGTYLSTRHQKVKCSSWESGGSGLELITPSFAMEKQRPVRRFRRRVRHNQKPLLKECVILHVDNDPTDSTVFHRALMGQGYHGIYRRVRNVEVAQAYLERQGAYSNATLFPLPDIIVTELLFEAEDGIDFIRWIRRHRASRKTPVIAFSACTDAKMREQSIEAGATSVVEKTSDYAGLVTKVREIVELYANACCSGLSSIVTAFNFFWPYAIDTFSERLFEFAV